MRLLFCALLTVSLTGCMCRSGVIDCTTGRAYPGFCKPLCGGPCDPFVWLAGDCSNCCCCAYKCAYTPYGGITCCGDEMVYGPSCVAPPLKWAPPAVPTAPSGHTVYPPGPAMGPGPASAPAAPPMPATAEPSTTDTPAATNTVPAAPPSAETSGTESEIEPAPSILHDARNDRPERSRL
jgi:hypothetical protein